MEIDKIVELVKKQLENYEKKRIPIEASGRHIHLSEKDAEFLFGKDYKFTAVKELSQPGQFACKERVRLIGPKGMIEGVIVAKNHIHMTPEDAERMNVKDKQLVKVKVFSKRPLIFEDVVIRVTNKSKFSMHIDYDEANACLLEKDSYGVIYE